MVEGHVHQNDVGTVFVVTVEDKGVVVDVSDVDVKQLRFRKPDGTAFAKDAAFVTDGTDGKIKYEVEDTTILDQAGTWDLQAFVHWETGDQWGTDLHEKFQVKENLA